MLVSNIRYNDVAKTDSAHRFNNFINGDIKNPTFDSINGGNSFNWEQLSFFIMKKANYDKDKYYSVLKEFGKNWNVEDSPAEYAQHGSSAGVDLVNYCKKFVAYWDRDKDNGDGYGDDEPKDGKIDKGEASQITYEFSPSSDG